MTTLSKTSGLPCKIAGDSASLGFLVKQSLAASPWLRLDEQWLHIDWPMAMTALAGTLKQKGITPAPDLVQILEASCSFVSLTNLCEPSQSGSYIRSSVKDIKFLSRQTALPEEVRLTLAKLADMASEVMKHFQARASSTSPRLQSSPHSWEVVRGLREIVSVLEKREVTFDVWSWFAVAKGDIAQLLESADGGSYGQQAADRHAAKKQKLLLALRRLVRAHDRLIEHLQNLDGVEPTIDLWRDSLGAEVTRLATSSLDLDKIVRPDLGGSLAGYRNRRDRVFSFKSQWESIDECGARGPLSDELATSEGEFYQNLDAMLWDAADDAGFHRYGASRQDQHLLKKFIENLGKARCLIRDVRAKLEDKQVSDQLCQRLTVLLDVLVEKSPFLGLLHAGFISPYVPSPGEAAWGLSLSPWASASHLSRRLLGSLPFTHLGFGGDDIADDDELGEETSPVTVEQDLGAANGESRRAGSMSGQSIWARLMEG